MDEQYFTIDDFVNLQTTVAELQQSLKELTMAEEKLKQRDSIFDETDDVDIFPIKTFCELDILEKKINGWQRIPQKYGKLRKEVNQKICSFISF